MFLITPLLSYSVCFEIFILPGCNKEGSVDPDHVIPVVHNFKKAAMATKQKYEVWKSQKVLIRFKMDLLSNISR